MTKLCAAEEIFNNRNFTNKQRKRFKNARSISDNFCLASNSEKNNKQPQMRITRLIGYCEEEAQPQERCLCLYVSLVTQFPIDNKELPD